MKTESLLSEKCPNCGAPMKSVECSVCTGLSAREAYELHLLWQQSCLLIEIRELLNKPAVPDGGGV